MEKKLWEPNRGILSFNKEEIKTAPGPPGGAHSLRQTFGTHLPADDKKGRAFLSVLQ
jgi:hypothetical protein